MTQCTIYSQIFIYVVVGRIETLHKICCKLNARVVQNIFLELSHTCHMHQEFETESPLSDS